MLNFLTRVIGSEIMQGLTASTGCLQCVLNNFKENGMLSLVPLSLIKRERYSTKCAPLITI